LKDCERIQGDYRKKGEKERRGSRSISLGARESWGEEAGLRRERTLNGQEGFCRKSLRGRKKI